ncbi:MAG: HD domain-containing protein [Lachnospiraceae bacterium]|nr:HD domain-containing protein [Lachnospiraceae bacterium]
MITYYLVVLIISMLCSLAYFWFWRRSYSVVYSILFALIPITNIGYLMLPLSQNLREAMLANKLCYLGGSYLVMFVGYYIFDMCGIDIGRAGRFIWVTVNSILYGGALLIGYNGWYYKSADFEIINGIGTITDKVYGPMHTAYYAKIVLEVLVSFFALIYTYVRKRTHVSIKNIGMLFFLEFVSIFSFFLARFVLPKVELLPAAYALDQMIFLVLASRTLLYDIRGTVSDTLVTQGELGFATFDFHMRYLGCNETAIRLFPAFGNMRVDFRIGEKNRRDEGPAETPDSEEERKREKQKADEQMIRDWIEQFRNNELKNYHVMEDEETESVYRFEFGYLFDGKLKRGYRVLVTDVTRQEKYLSLLQNYRKNLEEEVRKKTHHVQLLQDQMILGMATMVESRDNSTGGHIRRTSDVVKILVEEIRKDNVFGLTAEFCENLVKAAPMHDLGKIAVDDAILRKPGRFTPEEFEKMKTHAAEGARVIRQILRGAEDETFRTLAENVAHYHHERWDGSGYPEGLKGEEIPMEARIMAVADVYDALVSKRCYKESMSFADAYKIITESMGTHFDKRLQVYFERAARKLEEYYADQMEAEGEP